jgi:UDP-N-acetyl-2-amino-2-deoxyglucuronate dehydrogenase
MNIKIPRVILNRPIKVALVGCGRISENHFKSIAQHHNDIVLDAICDVDRTALENAMERYKVLGYDTVDELLKRSDADLIVLCTPSGLHANQTIKAALANRHVLTEKPMATTWEDGLRMVRVCQDEKRHLFVVKQNRLNSTIQLLKRAIDAGRFGKIHMVSLNVFWHRPQSYYDQAPWRGTKDLDGGAFMNQASHYIDLLRWLLGPVDSIHAMLGKQARNIEAEDSGVLNVRWSNGAMGSVSVTMLTYPKNYEGSITILGEKGSVRIGGVAVNEIQHWTFEEEHPDDQCIRVANYETSSVYGFGHPLYYENVIQCLRGNATASVDGVEGLTSLELITAAYRSAGKGETIQLPLEHEYEL